jgi:hypothetical protein
MSKFTRGYRRAAGGETAFSVGEMMLFREQKSETRYLDNCFPAFGPLVVAKLRTEQLDFLQEKCG